MIMEMPGKLDHASVVAYCVGKWTEDNGSELKQEMQRNTTVVGKQQNGATGDEEAQNEAMYEAIDADEISVTTPTRPGEMRAPTTVRRHLNLNLPLQMAAPVAFINNNPNQSPAHRSPYEDVPVWKRDSSRVNSK